MPCVSQPCSCCPCSPSLSRGARLCSVGFACFSIRQTVFTVVVRPKPWQSPAFLSWCSLGFVFFSTRHTFLVCSPLSPAQAITCLPEYVLGFVWLCLPLASSNRFPVSALVTNPGKALPPRCSLGFVWLLLLSVRLILFVLFSSSQARAIPCLPDLILCLFGLMGSSTHQSVLRLIRH